MTTDVKVVLTKLVLVFFGLWLYTLGYKPLFSEDHILGTIVLSVLAFVNPALAFGLSAIAVLML